MEQTLFIARESAIRSWRWYRIHSDIFNEPLKTQIKSPEHCAYTQSKINELMKRLALPPGSTPESVFGKTLHIATACSKTRSFACNIKSHVWPLPPMTGSFLQLSNNVFVESPEVCLLQTISFLPVAKSLMLAMEFSGTYTYIDQNYQGSYIYSLQPLIQKETLLTDIESFSKVHGSFLNKAFRTFGYMEDGSASVMETRIYLLMTLPHKYGGYGLKHPVMNYAMNRQGKPVRPTTPGCIKPDFYWAENKLALEYNSLQYHNGMPEYERDAERREHLEKLGIRVIPVSRQKVYDPEQFDALIKDIATTMKHRLRLPKTFVQKRNSLRNAILLS